MSNSTLNVFTPMSQCTCSSQVPSDIPVRIGPPGVLIANIRQTLRNTAYFMRKPSTSVGGELDRRVFGRSVDPCRKNIATCISSASSDTTCDKVSARNRGVRSTTWLASQFGELCGRVRTQTPSASSPKSSARAPSLCARPRHLLLRRVPGPCLLPNSHEACSLHPVAYSFGLSDSEKIEERVAEVGF